MTIFRRPPADPELERARAEAAREQARAQVEAERLRAQVALEQQAAQAEFARQQAAANEQEKRRRDALRRTERAERRERNRKARAEFAAKARPVLPLLLINGGAAYAQAAYAYTSVAPDAWNMPSKLAFAVAFAVAIESIAVYVQWHAHDALMLNAHATAASLRRASWGIAAVVAGINYAHFAGPHARPTAAAVAFALLSLLSPWLWGLHTRRAQHLQLLAEDADLIDEGGVEFSPQRRRAFPVRAWLAKRWSIDHYERDPRRAWEGYNAEREARRAARAERRRQATKPPAKGKPVAAPQPAASQQDDLSAIVDAIATPDPTPATHRPRLRPSGGRVTSRLGRRRPAINVTVLAADKPRKAATEPANDGRKVAAPKAAKQAATTEQKVAALIARNPTLTQADVAARLQLGTRTVRRYWPKPVAAVNGHDHTQEQ
ncbi:hypothetical protein AB0875_12430 [Micromonospora gifhornensis]|uniref:hypothetical protein n=1 Tax=Micromonospora gifhornensis TaxID=84594 RepID=UPI003454756D